MVQQQELENAITKLNNKQSKNSPIASFKCIKMIVKTLEQYFENPHVFPSERFIPCCLFTVPEKFYQILGHDPSTLLLEKPDKMSFRLVLQMYLKGMLKLLGESSDQIKHIVIEGMSRAIMLIGPFIPITKRWVKALLQLWSHCSDNLNIALRCHIALSKYFSTCDVSMYMWGLRRMYVSFFENCKQVSWRNFQHINFMINSLCEIVKVNTERAYYVLFGYLRSISLEIDKLHKSKRKERVEQASKLFSNQILNSFKLFTALVTRVNSEELTALIYPLCELLAAYERVSENPEYIPLKLHLLECELTISETLGIYIPHTLELIQKLLKSPIFNKKLSKKSQRVEANIQLAYKISKDQLKQAHLVNELFRSLMTKVYWFNHLASKNSFGSEVQQKIEQILKKQNYSFSEYKIQCKNASSLIKADAQALYDLRADEKMTLQSIKKIKKFEMRLKETNFPGDEKYKQLKEEEEDIMKKKLAAENEEAEEGSDAEVSNRQDDDQVNSGWEEPSEGASEFNMEENLEEGEEESGPVEEISYEGDPEDIDEVAKQWSEEQWDSQQNI